MEEDIFNSELGRKILALTKASFKVSDLIPDLVFREKIKIQTLNVYEKFITRYDLVNARSYLEDLENTDLLKEIDILDHYFYLGGHLNLIKEEHLKQLRNGFLVFKSLVILLNNNASEANKNTPMMQSVRSFVGSSVSNIADRNVDSLNDRQKKIMEKFQNKETLKLAELLDFFPDISERTIRNELNSLIGFGKITRDGRGNGSFYKIIDS